jgi:uncharacterized protein
MLSGNLNLSRYRNGVATPFQLQLSKKHLDIAANLIDLFENSIERKRFEIEEEIKSFYVEKINPKALQGLAKILFRRGAFSDFGKEDPQTIRMKLFSQSAKYWKNNANSNSELHEHCNAILEKAGVQDQHAFQETDSWLFGDVTNNQKLISFDSIQPDKLIHRYNIEQVQGLLLYCEKIELGLILRKDLALRQVMQMLKFHQLMFEVTETSENRITLTIDGPSSILENSRSYGIEIANFFPVILLLKESWQLTAFLKVPKRHRRFRMELSDQNSYSTFYKHTGIWNHEKVQNLTNRINEKYENQLEAEMENRLIPLSRNRYLLPDIILKEPGGEKTLLIEWFHYLSESRIKQLQQAASEIPENYVFAVKGKKTQLAKLSKKLGKHLIIFAKELTAPSLFKKFNEF